MLKKELALKDIDLFAKELKTLFKKPQVLLLEGPLGVGKTTLVRALLNNIDSTLKNTVSSPSFAIQNNYQTKEGEVWHIDLYRLKDDEDLESTGFWDRFADPQQTALIIIEWANRLNVKQLPPHWNYLRVLFSFIEKNHHVRSVQVSDPIKGRRP